MSHTLSGDALRVETTLPRPWEQEVTFHDTLYAWMQRAPWLMLSALAHLLVFFVLAAIPWDALRKPEERPLIVGNEPVEPEVFEREEPEIEKKLEIDPIEDPTPVENQQDEFENETDNTPDEVEKPFSFIEDFDQNESFTPVLGLKGAPDGSKLGGRPPGGKGQGGGRLDPRVEQGLAWLAAHQAPDGSWRSEAFDEQCGELGAGVCDGAGSPVHDVGVTGLALLAFLGAGHTTEAGAYRPVVARGIAWLRDQQDPDSGLVGTRASHEFLYDHAIATLALCEAYYFNGSPLLRRTAQGAVDYIQRARNPYGAWRYEVPPDGTSDSSVTGWMVFALATAKETDLVVDPAALEGALSFLDEVTDPRTGRVGYTERDQGSSRVRGANEHYPRDRTETLTAVGLLCRIFMGQDPTDEPLLARHADLMRQHLPEWGEDGRTADMYYWYYGTYAMYQMSAHDGAWWRAWREPLEEAIRDHQRENGDAKGSWDPVGPWGHAGGRVYSTALMVLCLEVTWRYSKVLGGR